MPVLRTLLAIPLAATLFCMFPGSSTTLAAPATDATLPLLVTEGKAPAAALLAREGMTTRFVRTGPTIRRTDHFRAGSITKSFIATVVLQLAAEHRLRLSDTVDDHLPGLLRDHSVSLHSLLTHTSGLPDFTARTHGTIPISPQTAVQLAEADPPIPRNHWSYSNTNYVVLGMVIGQVTGHSYATEARRRIIEPLHLTGTSFPGTRTTLPTPHGHAYDATGDDVTTLNPRVAGAAGELVSTLTDLNRFYTALLKGRLLPRVNSARCSTPAPHKAATAWASTPRNSPAERRYGATTAESRAATSAQRQRERRQASSRSAPTQTPRRTPPNWNAAY